MADKCVWHVLPRVLRMNRLIPNPSPPSKSESGHYWWYMCDAIYTSWFRGECSDKRRARPVFFSRLSWPLQGFVLVWSLKETRYRERVPSHLRSGEAVASAQQRARHTECRSAECSATDQTLFVFILHFLWRRPSKRNWGHLPQWIFDMAGSSTLDVFVGIVLVLHTLGSVFQITRGELTAEGEWVLVDSSIICIDDRSLFWRYG